MPAPITIAHLTDVHLGPIVGFTPRFWNAKRVLGYVNWTRKRRAAYRRDVLDRIVADVHAQRPDHIVVTGDLANIGLPQEHIQALAWLQNLGPPDGVTVIPGNHDIYSNIGSDPGTARWTPYMSSNAAGIAYAKDDAEFPFVRGLGSVALIGLNSAVLTRPFIAWGEVGRAQRDRLAGILDPLGRDEMFRLVLIHHPPLPGQCTPFRGLRDAQELEQVLAASGAELVIHGHNHHNMLTWVCSAAGPLPVVGVPSASLGERVGDEPLARYNLYRIAGPPWSIELVGRGLSEPGGVVKELERTTLKQQRV
jgi:3',5'-cyclic AMP phosphodiesterase CpdA